MGNKRSTEEPITYYVTKMWWEGKDFHTIDTNGNHMIYKNAILIDADFPEPEENIND